MSERPRADRHDHGDVSKVAIGGVVRGLEAIAERYGSGTLEWSQYLQPAIASAEEGAIVTSFMYGINYNLMEQGDLVKNPRLARPTWRTATWCRWVNAGSGRRSPST